MADLLDDMGDLGVHCLLVGGHSLKLGGQLIDRITKSFINLGLGHMKRSMRLSKLNLGYCGG